MFTEIFFALAGEPPEDPSEAVRQYLVDCALPYVSKAERAFDLDDVLALRARSLVLDLSERVALSVEMYGLGVLETEPARITKDAGPPESSAAAFLRHAVALCVRSI